MSRNPRDVEFGAIRPKTIATVLLHARALFLVRTELHGNLSFHMLKEAGWPLSIELKRPVPTSQEK